MHLSRTTTIDVSLQRIHQELARDAKNSIVQRVFSAFVPGHHDKRLTLIIRHRFPTSHSCSPAEVSEAAPSTVVKNARARELLQRNFPQALVTKGTSSSAQLNRVGKTPAAQAQIEKVQFMKMRQAARPGDPKTPSLPPAERHHVLVKFEETGAEKTLWFNKVSLFNYWPRFTSHSSTCSQFPLAESLIFWQTISVSFVQTRMCVSQDFNVDQTLIY